MSVRRGHKKRSSEGDVALVQMQIAAQARNERWHEFLCAKRDELQARLRQQGYSERSGGQRHVLEESGHFNDVQDGLEVPAPDEMDTEQLSTRWNVDAPEGDPVRGVEDQIS